MKRFLTIAASALAIAGCTVGPDYSQPRIEAPSAQGELMSAASPRFSGDEPPGRWWSLFNDPVLDRLVSEALSANTDLRVAAANLRQARAVLQEQRAGRLPNTNVSGGATYGRPSQAGVPAGFASPEQWTFDAGIDLSYQVDLFGRVTRAIEASRADAEAVQAAFDTTRITVAAETTRAYADACTAGRQLATARESLRIQEQTFDLTRRLFEGGRVTALDTNRAGALLEQVRASIPQLEGERRAALFRLAVLTGRPPAEFPQDVANCERPPSVATVIPVGNGASLLARRPDIREAERRLAAATARIGVATAELYPSISLGGGYGFTGNNGEDFASSRGFRFSLGPLISWSFPNVAVARTRIAQAEAGAEAALATFDGTWLRALQETESGLTRYAAALDRVATLERGRERSREAARIARLRYQAGAENFQIVLDAERSLAEIEGQLAAAEGDLSTQLVTLFLALGGGWQAETGGITEG